MTLAAMLDDAAARSPHAIAIHTSAGSHSYADLADRVARVAHGFISLGLTGQDRQALLLPNGAELAISLILHCFPNFIPGLHAFGDTPDIAAVTAPRPSTRSSNRVWATCCRLPCGPAPAHGSGSICDAGPDSVPEHRILGHRLLPSPSRITRMASRVARLASASALAVALTGAVLGPATAGAQDTPYDVFPAAEPPYYRVRYEAGTRPGELIFPVSYTIWIPPGVTTLRGVVVHQHGCGEGSCASGLTAAYDLHWQALARAHECGLLGPAYEQPDKADCQMWCDPRNGSAAAFQRALADLGRASGHPELASVPWAMWGHSGGGHWCGGMVMLFPERVAAAWLRSGVPLLEADPARAGIRPHTLPDAALGVPIMCNPGTQEGVTVKEGPFAGVWPDNERFFRAVRGKGGLVGVAVDPLSSHECGNQRYLAIPWLDACLTRRLLAVPGGALRPMPTDTAWLGPITGGEASPAATSSAPLTAAWLPNGEIARKWAQYVADTAVDDDSPPPAPRNLSVAVAISSSSSSSSPSVMLAWEPLADLESGLAGFVVERDGEVLARLPQDPKNPFGRPLFQNLQYSDTPTQPLVEPRFTDPAPKQGVKHVYRIRSLNTAGLESPLSDPVTAPVTP